LLVPHLQVLDPEVGGVGLGLYLGGRVFLGLLRSKELLADVADEIKQSHYDLLEFSITVQAHPAPSPPTTAGWRARTPGPAAARTLSGALDRPHDDHQPHRAARR